MRKLLSVVLCVSLLMFASWAMAQDTPNVMIRKIYGVSSQYYSGVADIYGRTPISVTAGRSVDGAGRIYGTRGVNLYLVDVDISLGASITVSVQNSPDGSEWYDVVTWTPWTVSRASNVPVSGFFAASTWGLAPHWRVSDTVVAGIAKAVTGVNYDVFGVFHNE